MILTCPDCTTRYRFDDAKIPERGVAVRCKRCRTVFRAQRPGTSAPVAAKTPTPVESAAGRPATAAKAGGKPSASSASAKGGSSAVSNAAAKPASGPVLPLSVAPVTSVPISVGGKDATAAEGDVRRLTRIILSDIVIYSPDRADQAIRDGRFPELYRAEIEEGRKMIRARFPSTSDAVDTYEKCLQDLLETRRKELQQTTTAL